MLNIIIYHGCKPRFVEKKGCLFQRHRFFWFNNEPTERGERNDVWCFFCNGLSRIFTVRPCCSVPFRCYYILIMVFYIGVSRVSFRVSPCRSVALIFCLWFFASEFHGYPRMFSVPFRCWDNCVWCWSQLDLHGTSVWLREIPLL